MTINRRDLLKTGLTTGMAGAIASHGISRAFAQSPVTINVAQWGTEAEIKAMQQVVESFNQSRKDIQIQFVTIPHPSYNQQLDTRLAGGSGPDVFKQTFGLYGRYIKAGIGLDLAPYLPADAAEQYVPTYWNAGRSNGKQFAVPMNTDELMVYYNVEALQKAGVPTPPKSLDQAWTLDQFLEVGRAVQKSGTTRYGLTSYARFPRTFLLLLQAMGGTFFAENGARANLNSPEGIAAIAWLAATFKEGLSPVSSIWGTPDSPDVLFAQGATALHIGGCWQLPLFDSKINGFTYDVTFLPRGKIATADLGGGGFLVNKGTKYPKEAVEVLLYLTGPQSMTGYLIPNYFLPTRNDLQASEIAYPSHRDKMKLFIEQTKAITPDMIATMTNPSYGQSEAVVKQELGQALLGRKSPEQAAKDADLRINQILQSS